MQQVAARQSEIAAFTDSTKGKTADTSVNSLFEPAQNGSSFDREFEKALSDQDKSKVRSTDQATGNPVKGIEKELPESSGKTKAEASAEPAKPEDDLQTKEKATGTDESEQPEEIVLPTKELKSQKDVKHADGEDAESDKQITAITDSEISVSIDPEVEDHAELMDFITAIKEAANKQHTPETTQEMAEAELQVVSDESDTDKNATSIVEQLSDIPEDLLNQLFELINKADSGNVDEKELNEKMPALMAQLLAAWKQPNDQTELATNKNVIPEADTHTVSQSSDPDAVLLATLLFADIDSPTKTGIDVETNKPTATDEGEAVKSDLITDIVNGVSKKTSSETTEQQNVIVQQVITDAEGKGSQMSVKDRALSALVNLSGENLEQALNRLAERLTEQAQSGSAKVEPEAVKVMVADFVAHLKAGLSEIKAQRQQGHEPGIDLSTLVKDAVKSVEGMPELVSKHAEPLEQKVAAFSGVLEFAHILNQQSEHVSLNSQQLDRIASQEVGQLQTEVKTAQLYNSQFNKAVNIAKPEGHSQLAEKVRYMVNQKSTLAEIRLDPPDLGSMTVKVNVQGDSASVSFVVQSQQARDMLEQATPRLREMLAESGIELGQSSVEQENSQGSDAGDEQLAGGQQHSDDGQEDVGQSTGQQRIVNGVLGGIDYFV